MNIEEIKALADIMNTAGLTDIKIEENGTKIQLTKSANAVMATPVVIPEIERIVESYKPELSPIIDGKIIKSPTVGIFYASPSPEENSYVTVGSKIKSGDVVCIIEAMKLMNEIQADSDGEIVEILVNNGDVVEFDQALFKIK